MGREICFIARIQRGGVRRAPVAWIDRLDPRLLSAAVAAAWSGVYVDLPIARHCPATAHLRNSAGQFSTIDIGAAYACSV
jgi:hypothetical protein